ncbi:MAG: LysM peptidoglycan-binding domain-containing protein, partial [Leptospirales bacterium]
SAPKMVAARKTEANGAITAADEAYAEVLAAQDFAAAKSLYQEGEESQNEAETKKSETSAAGNMEERMALLTAYNTAGRKFTDAGAAAERAKNVALSQKGDMLDSLDGIRSNLRKAEEWGAADDDLNELAAARASLAQAEKEIDAGQLKKGNATMQEAEAVSKALLAKVANQYARKKLAEANTAVAKANQDFTAVNTDKNRKVDETRDILDTIDAQLTAAKEARDSAANYLAKNNPEQSISESEDAIRLSQIIFEQYNLLAAAQTRDSSEIGEGGPDSTTTDETETAPEGWREYVVVRKVPADCLWCIAKRTEIYGNGRLWNRIYQANKTKIKNPNRIYPGQRLWIPPKSGDLTRPQPAVKDEEETITVDPDADESTLMEKVEEKIDEALESADSDETDADADAEEQPAESVE